MGVVNSSKIKDRDYELDKANLIWDEYKYRHEHIWKLIFQVTTAVIAVSIVPYVLNDELANKLGGLIIVLPIIGLCLALFSSWRLIKECLILDKIRPKHREFHKLAFGIDYEKSSKGRTLIFSSSWFHWLNDIMEGLLNKIDNKKSKEQVEIDYNKGKFTSDVMIYLLVLVALAFVNIGVILFKIIDAPGNQVPIFLI